MFLYEIYGHLVESEIDLLDLPLKANVVSEPKQPSIQIKAGEGGSVNREYLDNETCVHDEYGYYYRKGVGLFEFFKGNVLRATLTQTPLCQDVVRILLNYPMACVLSQRGYFLLHASAVSFNGKNIIFPGPSLSGKSTIASFLITKGAKLISEDTAVIDFRKREILIHSSYPMIKISTTANNEIKFSTKSGIEFPNDQSQRRGHLLGREHFALGERELHMCIFPQWDEKYVGLKRLDFSQSLPLLMNSSLSIYPLTKGKEKNLFKKNSAFFRGVDTFSFTRNKDYASLHALLDYLS